MKKPILIPILLTLAACSTKTTGPLIAGDNTYILSRQAGIFPSGREPLLAEAIAEATEKCSSSGKKIQLISSTENPGPYVMGNYPKATITFSCL